MVKNNLQAQFLLSNTDVIDRETLSPTASFQQQVISAKVKTHNTHLQMVSI